MSDVTLDWPFVIRTVKEAVRQYFAPIGWVIRVVGGKLLNAGRKT